MRKIAFALFFALTMFFTTSCVTDGYVTYRAYPVVTPHYVYGYTPDGRVFVHTHPYYHWHYYPKPHHFPNHSHSQRIQPPTTPPKPTTVPKATVRQGNNGGSMSGANRRR
jgi:hypothetical protein